jgi:hypothetical protein
MLGLKNTLPLNILHLKCFFNNGGDGGGEMAMVVKKIVVKW